MGGQRPNPVGIVAFIFLLIFIGNSFNLSECGASVGGVDRPIWLSLVFPAIQNLLRKHLIAL